MLAAFVYMQSIFLQRNKKDLQFSLSFAIMLMCYAKGCSARCKYNIFLTEMGTFNAGKYSCRNSMG